MIPSTGSRLKRDPVDGIINGLPCNHAMNSTLYLSVSSARSPADGHTDSPCISRVSCLSVSPARARQMATPIALASVVYLACRLVLPEARQMATPIDVSSYRPPMKCDGKLVSASSPCLPGTGRGRTGDGPTFPERTPTFPKRTPTFPECTPAQYFVP